MSVIVIGVVLVVVVGDGWIWWMVLLLMEVCIEWFDLLV